MSKVEHISQTLEEFKGTSEYDDLKRAGIHLDGDDGSAKTIEDVIKATGGSLNNALMSADNIEEKENETEYWGQYRGDYLDLRDYFKAEGFKAKRDYLKKLSKARVTLIREHIISIWTFRPDMRDEIDDELEMICKVMYSGKDELEDKKEDESNTDNLT